MSKKILSLLLAVSLITTVTCSKAKADPTPDVMFGQLMGVLTGAFFSPLFGVPRGAVVGAIKGTKKVAEKLGDENGKPHRVLGAFTGGFGGLVAGGFAGFLKAEHDAFKYGYSSPFSDESFSLSGQEFLEYDPFTWSEF
ncbi:MAG: hypothetical protein HYZ79_02885 [Candidatus Melainabacteria bacterium]|nr:hypothetical protein [Candidatus Melainabacteria bacterium]